MDRMRRHQVQDMGHDRRRHQEHQQIRERSPLDNNRRERAYRERKRESHDRLRSHNDRRY